MEKKRGTRMIRLNRIDWLNAALDTLEEEGVEKIRVERLARDLGVTRGSFYWHFRDRGDLLETLLEYYDLACTAPVTKEIGKLDLPPGRLLEEAERMAEKVGRGSFERAMYGWALSDPVARQHLRRNVGRRLAFALDIFRKAGFEGDDAEARAGMFVCQQMGRSLLEIPEKKNKGALYARIRARLLTEKLKK